MITRRKFLYGLGAAGAVIALLPKKAFARSYNGQLLITIQANGGWDPTIWMDPKIGAEYQNAFAEDDIIEVSGLRFAPYDASRPYQVGVDGDTESFIHRYASRLLVINGVDTQTNSHDIGPRHCFSGSIREDNPALAALFAATVEAHGGALPTAFLTSGGFASTQGLLPTTRTAVVDSFVQVAEPNRLDGETFVHADALRRINESEGRRQARRLQRATLPRARRDLERHFAARSLERDFSPIIDTLGGLPAYAPREADNAYELDQVKLVVAAMASGMCAGAHLALGAFDTHSADHDIVHRTQAENLMQSVDYLWRTAGRSGIADRLTVVIGSDFGRTTYNSDGGKDHWPITSYMLMGKQLAGGRTVGRTRLGPLPDGQPADGHLADPVRLQDGQLVVTEVDDPEGFILRPGHLHQALRAHLGITNHPLATRFPLRDATPSVLPLL